MKAKVYGLEIEIKDFHLGKRGTPYCKVRYLSNNWIVNVPVSCIDLY